MIINPFRLKPLDEFLPAAADAGVAVLARVPLASGLLSGRYTTATTFSDADHRSYNREGQAFDKGETFSGSISRPAWRPRRSCPRRFRTA
jgi:aryl-alcohol dehydrogenase-like predicted oxidoreductase